MAKMWVVRTESGEVYFSRRKPTVKLEQAWSVWRERFYTQTNVTPYPSFTMCYSGFRRNSRIKLAKNKPTLVKIVRA